MMLCRPEAVREPCERVPLIALEEGLQRGGTAATVPSPLITKNIMLIDKLYIYKNIHLGYFLKKYTYL